MGRTQERRRKTGENNISLEMQTTRNTGTDCALEEAEGGIKGNTVKNRKFTEDFRTREGDTKGESMHVYEWDSWKREPMQ